MKNRLAGIVLTVMALLLAADASIAADTEAQVAKPAAGAGAVDTKGPAKRELVDINSATSAELKAIPGLGGALAARIVANRPYANKTQLKSRKIIPQAVYEKIRDQVIARQPKKR